jgi:hypothetical protein
MASRFDNTSKDEIQAEISGILQEAIFFTSEEWGDILEAWSVAPVADGETLFRITCKHFGIDPEKYL